MFRVVLSLFLSLSLLSGCGNSRELNQYAIVLGTAIDLTEDGEIELSVQFLNPEAGGNSSGGGGSGGGGNGSFSIVRTGKGLTVSDAASKLQELIPRKLFWGHCKVFVFGERLVKEGISDVLDYIVRAPYTREQAKLFVSKGDAKQILYVQPPMEKVSSRVIRLLSELNILMSITVIDFVQMMISVSNDSYLPYVDILPPNSASESGQETVPFITGTAVLKHGKLVGVLDDRLTRGIMWMKNDIKDSQVVVKNPLGKGSITLSPFQATTHLVPIIKNGQWKIIVKSRAKGEIIENETNIDLMNPQIVRIVEKQIENDISKRIQKSFNKLQKDMNADIVDIAETFERKYTNEFKKVKDHWDEKFKNIQLEIDVDAHITGPGLFTIPANHYK